MYTSQTRFISPGNPGLGIAALAISNDGRYIATGTEQVFDTHDCGDPYGADKYETHTGYQMLRPCPTTSLSLPVWQSELEHYSKGRDYRFADDSRWLSYSLYKLHAEFMDPWPHKSDTIGIVIYAADTVEIAKRPDYIALGDSYSSGEGDIGRKSNGSSYYLKGTENEHECHLSGRSYPYLLRVAWGIAANKMKSVACSGAWVDPDMNGSPVGYDGQANIKKRSESSATNTDALDTFKPGIVQQMQFVRKYQPQVITLTGGGNDIGFSKVLNYCATKLGTCDYAKEDSVLNNDLYSAIDTQYGKNRKLIREIQRLSPHTKIIMVGYPSFISDQSSDCYANAGFLNQSERLMINKMVSNVNSMLQRVAYDTSVQYVNIEQSLYGGRMCEDNEYLTDVWDHLAKHRAAEQERFHPNAAGHRRIADTIIASGAYTSGDIPPPGSYAPPLQYTFTSSEKIIPKEVLELNSKTKLKLDSGKLHASSSYALQGFSEPIDLGAYTSNPDGSADATVSLLGMEPGKHVLVLTGTGPDGQPVRYYQFIEVHVSLNDADGDGIANNNDSCNFFNHWYDEKTGEDVCATKTYDDGEGDNSGVHSLLIAQNIEQGNEEKRTDAQSDATQKSPYHIVKRMVEQPGVLWTSGIIGSVTTIILLIATVMTIKWRKYRGNDSGCR